MAVEMYDRLVHLVVARKQERERQRGLEIPFKGLFPRDLTSSQW